ncbi:hypothetical protein, partial [Flavisphingomonas formosensis]|uniref:hypothetical protein n=1 Tax=Flavisphingomonas formosensis TaxID=861534 RepID=UPI001E63F25A
KRRSPINKRPSPLRNRHHPTLRRPRTENQNSATNATVVLERFSVDVNRWGFPWDGFSDSESVLAKEAGMDGSSLIA